MTPGRRQPSAPIGVHRPASSLPSAAVAFNGINPGFSNRSAPPHSLILPNAGSDSLRKEDHDAH